MIWNVADGSQAEALGGHAGPVRSIAFSPDGLLVVTASNDRTARVWEATTATGNRVTELRGHTRPVTTIVFATNPAVTPGTSMVVTASDDRTARIWDASSGSLLQKLT